MFNPDAYLETVEHLGVVAAIDRDTEAHRNNPLDDLWGHVAVLTVDGDGWTREAFDRLGDAGAAVAEARYRDGDDPDAAAAEAFRKHYERRGWAVAETTVPTYDETDRARVVIAAEDGYGTPETAARELGDWANGDVYELDFYAPYTCEVDGEAVTELHLVGSLGNVYFSDYLGSPEMVAECKSIIEDQPCPETIAAPATVGATWTLAA